MTGNMRSRYLIVYIETVDIKSFIYTNAEAEAFYQGIKIHIDWTIPHKDSAQMRRLFFV